MSAAALALAEELSRKTGLRCAALAGNGGYTFEISEESRYQAALENIAGGRSSRGVSYKCIALLVPEPARHDPGAVLVQISGHDVGHLRRDLGPVFSRELAAAGCSAAVASAMIVGGRNRIGGNAGHFGVKLDAVHPFRFEGVDETTPAAAEAAPSSNDAEAEGTSERPPRSSPLAVGGRIALAAGVILAGMVTKRLALALAIFLAGVATGAVLIVWLRPASAPPLAVQSELPAAPETQASDPDPTETAAPAELPPLPRRRPAGPPGGSSGTGQQQSPEPNVVP
jgi:hypothetical protein